MARTTAAVSALVIACACLVVMVVLIHQSADNNANALLDPDLGSSGSGLDYGLEIPKPTLSSSQVKRLVKYEHTRTKLLKVIRKLESKMAGVERPLVEIRVATAGVKGLPGPVGAAGKTGPVGMQGDAGPPGPLGVLGKQGPAGPPGVNGPPGPPGQTGRRGAPGEDGEQGPRGPRGDRGRRGRVGRPGRVGPRGEPGTPGARGDIGPRGRPGERGENGPVGPIGPAPYTPGEIRGTIVNVVDGKLLSGVTLQLLQHKRIVSNLEVDRTGEYTAKVDPGQYTVQASAPGFMKFHRHITVVAGETTQARMLMNPDMPTGEMRIVLSWGDKVKDLDLHLATPGKCIVGWQHKECKKAGGKAKMEVDSPNASGPETITINKLTKGTYKVFVHRYSSEDMLSSAANVHIYFPSGRTRVFTIGTDGSIKNGDKWEVVTIDGATGNIYGPVMQGTSWVSVPGTPATFSGLSTSQSGLNVWAASENVVYRRTGITITHKMGKAWAPVTGVEAVGVAASDLGVWVWDRAGHINARLGITPDDQMGTAWLPVPPPEGSLLGISFDGANAVATTTEGRVWWRAGIVSTNPTGTRWFQVPGRMTRASVYGNVLWGTRHGKIYRRKDMASSPPAGTGWERVPGNAQKVSVSNGIVWVVAERGLVFYRKGISQANRGGNAWGELTDKKRIKLLSAGNGVVWALDWEHSPVFRKGLSRTGHV